MAFWAFWEFCNQNCHCLLILPVSLVSSGYSGFSYKHKICFKKTYRDGSECRQSHVTIFAWKSPHIAWMPNNRNMAHSLLSGEIVSSGYKNHPWVHRWTSLTCQVMKPWLHFISYELSNSHLYLCLNCCAFWSTAEVFNIPWFSEDTGPKKKEVDLSSLGYGRLPAAVFPASMRIREVWSKVLCRVSLAWLPGLLGSCAIKALIDLPRAAWWLSGQFWQQKVLAFSRPLSVCVKIAHCPHVCVGFLRVLRFPPTLNQSINNKTGFYETVPWLSLG